MRCKEIMKRDVESISPLDTVQRAAQKMRDGKIGFLPVCDRRMRVVGAVTDRDLTIRVLADGEPASTTVREVMTQECVWCQPEDPLHKAEEIMARNHKSRIMCIDQSGVLVGVISLSDIAQSEEGNRASRTLRKVSEREVRI